MNEPAPIRHFDPADEELLLATIDRWLEKDVRPVVKQFDHEDRWPTEIVEQMRQFGLFGATVSPEYGGLGLPATTYAAHRDADLQRVDGDHRHLQLASDAGAGDREIRHARRRSRPGCRNSPPATSAAAWR